MRSALLFGSFIFLVVTGLACSASSSSSDGASPVTNEDNNLTGGSVATDGQFPSTLYIKDNCTASKVGPKHILTAAHCVVNEYDASLSWRYVPGALLSITTKVNVNNLAEDFPWIQVNVAKVHLPPVVQAAAPTRIYAWGELADLAIVELDDEAITKLADIPTASIDTDPVAENDEVIIQGYGCENGIEGPKDYTNVRLKYQSTRVVTYETLNVESAEQRAVDAGPYPVAEIYTSSYDSRQFFATRGQARRAEEASLCPGDSGGPAYRSSDLKRIVGVNSRSWKSTDPSSIGSTNAHTRFDAKTQWDAAGWLKSVPGISLAGSSVSAISTAHFDNCKDLKGWSERTIKVCGEMRSAYDGAGGIATLGVPTGVAGLEEFSDDGIVWTQRFEYGTIREVNGVTRAEKFGSRCEGKRIGGFYCGSALSDNNENHLYQCTAGEVPVLTVCEFGCRSMPSGVPDKCNDRAPRPDLCAGARRTGMYCARNFDRDDQKTLLRCENQRTVREVVCSRGCKGMPSGVPDKCND